MPQYTPFDEQIMRLALSEAAMAAQEEEVPVGAVLVYNGQIVTQNHNRNINLKDTTAHAEILCLRQACEILNVKRLDGAWIYVTKEPCPMCAGALVLAHIERLVYGCSDIKMGCAGTVENLVQNKAFNHQMEVVSGVLEEETRHQLQVFFQARRKPSD